MEREISKHRIERRYHPNFLLPWFENVFRNGKKSKSGPDSDYKAHDDHKRYMGNQQYGNSIFQSGSLNADHDQGRNPHIISNSFGNRS